MRLLSVFIKKPNETLCFVWLFGLECPLSICSLYTGYWQPLSNFDCGSLFGKQKPDGNDCGTNRLRLGS